MASVAVDRRTGNIIVRAYGGKRSGRVYKPSVTLPATATDEEIASACDKMDMKAGRAKRIGHALTVGGLVDYYIGEVCPKRGYSPTTIVSYRSNVRCYVHPTIGGIDYEQAEAGMFAELYELMRKPKERGGFGVCQRTVKKVHSMLSGCFGALVSEKVIERNVLRDLKVERGMGAEAKSLEHDDFDRLLDHLFSSQDVGGSATLDSALVVDAYTGVRRGEIPAFLIEDWYPRLAEMRVRGSIAEAEGRLTLKDTKTGRVRFVAVADAAARRIDRHIELQAEYLAERGVEQTRKTPLFADDAGGHIRPSRLTTRFRTLKRELGLEPGVTLKSLRHTQATYLLEDGENVKLVQQRMGHASQTTTVDIYAHVMPGRDRAAADRFGALAGNRREGQRADSGQEVNETGNGRQRGDTGS